MELKSVLSNPYLGYRLDPGEPGLLNKARANESTLKVTAQEQRNLNRLVNQAVREGRTVIWKGITYRPVIAGSFMGTAAGHTTVISVEGPENKTEFPENDYNNGAEIAPVTEDTDDQHPEGGIGASSASPAMDRQYIEESPDELTQEAALLQVSIGRLEAEIEQLDNNIEENGLNNVNKVQKKQQLNRDLQAKEHELNKIAMERLIKMQSDMTETLNHGLVRDSIAPVAMIKKAYGAGSPTPSQGSFKKIV